jgi:hypothetical protein
MGTTAKITGVLGALLVAAPCLAGPAQLTPVWQSRFINGQANAFNSDLDESDEERFREEAADYGPFDTYRAAGASVTGAFASATSTQISEILLDQIRAQGNIFANADASDYTTVSSGLTSNWMEVSFVLSEDTEVELDIYISVRENVLGSVQLWEETVDGPVPVQAEHVTAPNSTLDVTHREFLYAGEYRLRANVQGGAWSDGFSGEVEFGFGEYNVVLTVLNSACAADLDGDGDTDQADLGILLASYGVDAGGDLNGDGTTDQADLGILLADYNCG